MKIKYIQSVFLGLVTVLFAVSTFGVPPVVYAQSLQNWSEPINLSNSGSSTDPAIVIDSNGVIHVIWVDTVDGYKHVESLDGKEWTSPENANFPFLPEDEPRPAFLASSNGIIYIIWQNEDNALYYSQTQSEFLANSTSWSRYSIIADSVVNYHAVVDSQGTLHLSYVTNLDNATSTAGVYYTRLGGSGSLETVNIYSSRYFRSLDPTSAHVRIDVSNQDSSNNVYIVWDDRPQRRILMAKSPDDGESWGEVLQIIGPEESNGFQTPLNVEIHALENTLLLLWQIGEATNQCMQYSRWSVNGGDTWVDPVKMLDEFVGCPEEIRFFAINQNLSLLLLKIQGGLSLVAWNGNEWSDIQLQNELLELFNPTNFDSILLGCQQSSRINNILYVVGCDQGRSGDIWFTSRSLGPHESWYPPLSSWNQTGLITSTEQVISSLSSVGYLDNVHLFWVQSARSELDQSPSSIRYSRWDGENWLQARPILSNLAAVPLQISVTNDPDGRLLLVWADGMDSHLYFSWSVSEKAELSSEWIQPKIVPSVSRLTSSPDILADASGRIVIAYAVSINEGRGIYIVQSTDLGDSWSSPLLVFDAVSAGWEMIDNPRISLGGDGRLHLLFHRYSLVDDVQSQGLYYVQSMDGGVTWSTPELVKEGLIEWSDVHSYDQQAIHRMWQEKNGLEISYINQFSFDSGLTWEVPVKIISSKEETIQVSLISDQAGSLRLVQLSYGKGTLLQDWFWDGSHWSKAESKELGLKGDSIRHAVTYGITSDGNLVVPIMFENSDSTGKITDEIWGFQRLSNIAESTDSVLLPVIPTPGFISIPDESPSITPTSVFGASSSVADVEAAPPVERKLVGYFLLTVIVILTVVIIRPKRKNK